ncbi:MAG: caspase family protein [Deltaproteobacteria bacterium]|nr:caspase family protein [Deltaproteobacteria bacterium]
MSGYIEKLNPLRCGLPGWLFLTMCVLGALPLRAQTPVKVRRFALVAGANNGGAERVVLRYAQSDAKAFANVLSEIGGVQKQDELLILEASKSALQNGFDIMRQRLQSAVSHGTRLELVFYYSGHSDERGLLLGDDIFEFPDLKKELNQLPAKVKIGILDSCASGALVRIKGGRRTAPFLIDSSSEVSGYALLTSSSADENAQESERIGASYFTHYLISGLRGAADTNRDGRVTLSESYAYAFDETLYRTVSSRAGAQHPNYDFQLAGAGDLVLTDLRGTDAILVIPSNVSGRVFVRDMNGRLVAEINKSSSRKVDIALPRGRYEVTVESDSGLKRGVVRLQPGTEISLETAQLVKIKRSQSISRGGESDDGVVYKKYAATVFPGFSTNPKGKKAENTFAINVIGDGYALRGIEVGFLLNKRELSVRGLQWAWGMNRTYHLMGVQRAALNFASGDVVGVQMGMLNKAGTFNKGAQLGLVNVTGEKSGAVQLGFINYMPDGIFTFGAWASDTSLYNFGVKLGGRHTFSKFTMSTRGYNDRENWVSLGYGFGGHFEPSGAPLWMEIDLTGHWLFSDTDKLEKVDLLVKHKLTFGVRLYKTFSFFAGPLINIMVSEVRKSVTLMPVWESGTEDIYNWQISPGFLAGFQVEPKMGRFNTWKGNRDED